MPSSCALLLPVRNLQTSPIQEGQSTKTARRLRKLDRSGVRKCEFARTTLGDFKELLGMNVLHPAGVGVSCRGLRVSWTARRSRKCWRISCGQKSSRAGGAREGRAHWSPELSRVSILVETLLMDLKWNAKRDRARDYLSTNPFPRCKPLAACTKPNVGLANSRQRELTDMTGR